MTSQLYNDAILAEAKARHGHGRLPTPEVTLTCDNPLCGDRVTVDLRTCDGEVVEFAQHVRGCLLTQAAASVLGRHAVGGTVSDIERATADLRELLAGASAPPAWPELAMFAPVGAVASRHECVLLPFEAAAAALTKAGP
jgi:nitrogen fixation protein NifU and related proteins